jgi:hypothetical protein
METLELSPARRHTTWYFALVFGVVMAYLAIYARQKFLPAPDGSFFSSSDLLAIVFGALIALFFGSLESSVALQVSKPPLLITTRTWFGKLKTTKRIPLNNVAWARVIYTDEMLLSVEVGTHGHQTTSVVCVPYSEQNIPVAEQLCEKVASALRLENKGYHRYV